MAIKKRGVAVLLLGLGLCYGLFAQDEAFFDGDALNQRLRNYTVNVSNLIPDSTTLSNIWSAPPGESNFAVGVNGSVTFLDRKKVSSLLDGTEGFGGDHTDISQFPEAIPFLPGAAADLRMGGRNFDIGLCGMWVDSGILLDKLGSTFLGDGSNFSYRSFGVDARTVIVRERSEDILFGFVGIPYFVANVMPTITLQAGYYFTWVGFGIEAETQLGMEKVHIDFRNDSYLFALQASYEELIPIVKPYLGMRMILSKTDSGFSWETHAPTEVKGIKFPNGGKYSSGGIDGETYAYFQIYGGIGLNLLFFDHIVTLGFAYNTVTNHFGVNGAVRLLF